jgi:pimeloyl-ACP methyl ester carboxylesterase
MSAREGNKFYGENGNKQRGSLLLRILKWTGVSLIGLIFLVIISGLLFQAIASSHDAKRYPPPGRLFNLGTHTLHARIDGQGGPTVVLESPLGGSHLGWSLVQLGLATHTTVLSYDRAGYGWSGKGPRPRTADRLTDELWQLLVKSGVPKPYILVGQSFGGTLVRLLSIKHPEETAALLLIETSHENMFARMPEALEEVNAAKRQMAIIRLLAPLGLMRVMKKPLGEGSMDILPHELRPAARAAGYRLCWLGAVADETSVIETSLTQVRKAVAAKGPGPFTKMPVVVLTRGRPLDDKEAASYEIWMDMQKDLAASSTHGSYLVIEGSGHFIQADNPGTIIESVLHLLGQIRYPDP